MPENMNADCRWVKLHECIADSDLIRSPRDLAVFLFILVKANYRDCGDAGGVGEVVLSVEEIADAIGMSVRNVTRALAALRSSGRIAKRQRYRLPSVWRVVNYEKYQSSEVSAKQPTELPRNGNGNHEGGEWIGQNRQVDSEWIGQNRQVDSEWIGQNRQVDFSDSSFLNKKEILYKGARDTPPERLNGHSHDEPATVGEPSEGEPETREPKIKTVRKRAPKRSAFDPLAVEFPPPLDSPEFRDAWAEWVQHRAEIRKRLTSTTVSRQMAKLAGWGEATAIAAIHNSIEAGWQGLFEPKNEKSKNDPF